MNKNLQNQRAILDVFEVPSYITHFGTKDKALPYPVKSEERSSFKGKQFFTNPNKDGSYGSKLPEVYLEKKHPWVWYKDKKLDKKRGFWSGDFPRRDEFTLNITTEQYRERLKQEAKHAKQTTLDEETMRQLEEDEEEREEQRSKRRPRKPLYDLVYDGEEPYPSAIRNSMISGKDTLNPTQLSWERDFGNAKTMSTKYGEGIDQVNHGKPQFARVPIVRQTFYRRSSIPIGSHSVYTKRPQ